MKVAWEARCCGARPSSGTYLASKNIKRGTSTAKVDEAHPDMIKMSDAYMERGELLYLREG